MATGRAAKPTRTVVVAGVPEGLVQDEVLADILTIHFQKSRNNGGDVEEVTYPTRDRGVAYVTFEDQEVVESVLRKDEHQLEDRRLSQPCPLRVARYCEHAFSSVTSILNLAVFQGQFALEELVEEMKQQSTGLSFGPLQPNGHVAVQGSFPAIQGLRDLLLLKAQSLSEEDRRKESKSHQKPRRRLQGHGSTTETRSSPRDEEKQVVVLDTDIYHYMRQLCPWLFQANEVVISDVTDGDVTTVCVESAGRADAGQVSSVRKRIEERSLNLQQTLRKERIPFQGHSRGEKQRYRQVCERLKARYPRVLVIPYDTHMDIIGFGSELSEFTRTVMGNSHSR